MIDRQTRLLLAVSAGLWVALAAQSVTAALVVGEEYPFGGVACDGILESITSEFAAPAMAVATTFASTTPDHSEGEEDDRPTLRLAQNLPPATTGNSSSISQLSNWNSTPLVNAVPVVPPPKPTAALSTELKIILPIPPPFDLLRPV